MMDIDLKKALEDFTDGVQELAATKLDLLGLPETEQRDAHMRRLDFAMTRVQSVQSMLLQFQSVNRHARRVSNVSIPEYAQDTAYYALRGGCTVLAVVTYSAKQYIDSINNPDAPHFMHGLLAGIDWAAIGQVIGTIEGGLKK